MTDERPKLLYQDEPQPFEWLRPDGAASLLLICDHASNRIPRALDNLGLSKELLNQHVAWDIGAGEVARLLSDRLDASAVLAGYSRLVVDANRQPGDPTAIPEVSDGIQIPANAEITEHQDVLRTEEIFWPYHHAVSDGLAHLWRRGRPPILLSVHSFTPQINGAQRPWHVGILWNRDPRLAHALLAGLRARPEPLTVGDNLPYSGKDLAYSLDFHAGAAGLAHCAVEIRQDLVSDTVGIKKWANILGDIMSDVLQDELFFQVEHF